MVSASLAEVAVPIGDEELLDIEQAARFLNVSETSLRRWTNSGRLACLRVGRRRERRFRRKDLVAFMEDQPRAERTNHGDGVRPAVHHVSIGGIPVPYGAHLAGVHATDRARTQLAAAFLADGFRRGSVCFVVGEPRCTEEIVALLAGGHPAVRAEIEAGRLVAAAGAGSPRAQMDWFAARFLAATASGADSIRVVVDMWSQAQAMGKATLPGLEAEYDRVIARRFPVVTLCQYDARRFTGLEILAALKGHGDSFRYPVERLVG